MSKYISGQAIVDEKGKPSAMINYNSTFNIVMKVKFSERIIEPLFAFTLKDSKGLEITGTNTDMKYITTDIYEKDQIVTVTFTQKANLQLGSYALSLGCVNVDETGVEVYSRIYDALLFNVIGSTQMVGFFDLDSKITFKTSKNN